ncbi:MAG: DUF1554 domain-containing protein [Crocinitomicaceae bacterium]|nr:DUF1554 domain-containing protein [Crocinitomicaceae bacterium]
MLKLLSIPALFFLFVELSAQVSISPSGTQPDPRAMLDISSNDKGFLPPRLSTSERDAMPLPIPQGLIIYNTSTNCINMYSGISWYEVCGNCTPAPTAASAGADMLNLSGNTANLAANTPVYGTGLWSVSGSGGSFSSSSDPDATFTGSAGNSYTLTWTISNACGVSQDNITVSFIANAKRVFVSSTTTNGNIGGLSGADNICQTRADAASLGGTWKAWLSSSTQSVSSRFTQYATPYRLVDGTLIANNWADLTDGAIQNPINKTESGTITPNGFVWTHTTTNGSSATSNPSQICNNWTEATSGNTLVHCAGSPFQTNGDWTAGYSGCAYPCNLTAPLFCFEQ